MQVKALKTFQNKKFGVPPNGLVRAGIVVTVPDRQAEQWIRLKLVEQFDPLKHGEKMAPGPDKNKNLGDADENKWTDADEKAEREREDDEGNEDADGEGQPATRESDPPAGGQALRSSALRAGRRSRKKT